MGGADVDVSVAVQMASTGEIINALGLAAEGRGRAWGLPAES